jgi:hypothetical protein
MSGQGTTAGTIRREIDAKYGKFGKATPTPRPPGM